MTLFEKVCKLVEQGKGRHKISDELEITKDQAKHYIRRAKALGHVIKDNTKIGKTTIQLNHLTGEVEKEWVRTEPAVMEMEAWVKALEKRVAGKASRVEKRKPVGANLAQDCMLEISMFDAHIGKYSSEKNTGEKWNLQFAVDVYKQYVVEATSTMGNQFFGKILLSVGGDLFHSDSRYGKTEKSGNSLDMAGEWNEIIDATEDLFIWTIDYLRAIAAEVEVVIVPGNHDWQLSQNFNRILAAYYKDQKDVVIKKRHMPRAYVQWGVTLLGFTHGDKESWQDLGLIMAQEVPDMWVKTNERHWHTGHFHKSKSRKYLSSDEFTGVEVTTLPTLTSVDTWHHEEGYMGGVKRAECYLWHKEQGKIAVYTHKLSNIVKSLAK